MLKSLIDQLTHEQRAKLLKDWKITPQTISNWKSEPPRQWPTRYQAAALAEVCGIDRHALDDAIAMLQAKPEQRKLLERVMGKARGVVAGLLVFAAAAGAVTAELGSKALGPFSPRRKRRQCARSKAR